MIGIAHAAIFEPITFVGKKSTPIAIRVEGEVKTEKLTILESARVVGGTRNVNSASNLENHAVKSITILSLGKHATAVKLGSDHHVTLNAINGDRSLAKKSDEPSEIVLHAIDNITTRIPV